MLTLSQGSNVRSRQSPSFATTFARDAVSAVQETLLDLPEGHITHTRQVTPRSDFEKGHAELRQ